MKRLSGKYWKVLLSLAMAIGAAVLIFMNYLPGKKEFEIRERQIKASMAALQSAFEENMKYAGVQEKLEPAEAELEESRLALYQEFP